MSDPRKIEYIPLNELQADPRNPKAHDLETIDKSIGRFGVLDPIVRDGRTGYIISGHGRRKALEAMEERGETPPEGVQLSDSGKWLVPVATGWASRTDSEASAALIALNRTTELGGWVDDALLDLLEDLEDSEGGLVGVGFDEDSITKLAESLDTLSHEEAFKEFTEGTRPVTSFSGSALGEGEREVESDFVTVQLVMSADQRSLLIGWLNQLKNEYLTDTLAEGLLAYAEGAGYFEQG